MADRAKKRGRAECENMKILKIERSSVGETQKYFSLFFIILWVKFKTIADTSFKLPKCHESLDCIV